MAETQEIRSVLVTNISPAANEKTVSDFFSFCGKISKLYLKKEEGKETSFAVIQFETESAAKTALLLTNALIVDRPITVAAYETTSPNVSTTTTIPQTTGQSTPENLGTPVEQANITSRDFGGIPDNQRTKTSVVASLLAAGYVLTENALEKAKELDEKTHLSSRAQVAIDQLKVKAQEIDTQLGISEKATMVKNTVTETAKKVDNELGLSEKASMAASVIKSGAQSVVNASQQTFQKAQENATVKKGVENVKSTAQSVSKVVETTVKGMNDQFNDIRSETQREITHLEANQVHNDMNKHGVAPSSETVANKDEKPTEKPAATL